MQMILYIKAIEMHNQVFHLVEDLSLIRDVMLYVEKEILGTIINQEVFQKILTYPITEISPWLTEDQRLTMSHPYNQLPFPVFGCPNESFIPNQLKPDSMTTGLGDSPFSLLSRPPNFQENQTTHGSPNFYYDKPVAAQSGIPDHRHWRDRPIVKPNPHPKQPYWNNKPAPNQTTETMFWNKEQHSNRGVTNDQKYWNDESIGPEPPFWNEGHPEGYSRPGPPDRKVHTQSIKKSTIMKDFKIRETQKLITEDGGKNIKINRTENMNGGKWNIRSILSTNL